MRILQIYYRFHEQDDAKARRRAECAPENLSITPFALTTPRLRWDDLHVCWKTREPRLMAEYAALRKAAESCDVLLHLGGWNLHPDFVQQLPTFNVYSFFDDPESSLKQSRHVAPSFDAVLYGNIASGPQYASWGCRRIAHLPIFIDPASVPSHEEAKTSLSINRDNDIVLCCGMTDWRKRRLAGLMAAFPSARVHGNGWEGGWISDEQQRDLYRRSRIGWNIHNSTGPINLRLFMLPAWGVMQICDNKTGLGQLFELGKEVVGFDTIPEAIEKTRYYLAHDEERRHIAKAGHERFHREYHPRRLWARIDAHLQEWIGGANNGRAVLATSPERLDARSDVVSTIRRGAARWVIKQRKSVWRSALKLSGARTPDWHDESIYVGKTPEYRCGQRRRRRRGVLRDLSKDEHHLEAMCWAVTSLIGSANSIFVTGPHALRFEQLALVDATRSIQVLPEARLADAGAKAKYELGVCMTCPANLEVLSNGLAELLTLAPRVLICILTSSHSGAPDTDDIYRALELQSRVARMLTMADPWVPWLEPVTRRGWPNPLIIECKAAAAE